ncbi:unnamed protein product [marine sediment metagenome]|uniref:Uncharacterized protein n=1 Tax=marine sediment metagenome TaxID=412755 RepID=X1UEG7_9ZZZZ
MPRLNSKFTFRLPYDINVVEGQVIDDLVLPLKNYQGKVIIHPPREVSRKTYDLSITSKDYIVGRYNLD